MLEGRTAIITGAGSGVGRAAALRFAAHGANVVCADLRDDWAAETVDLVSSAGGVAVAQHCDVTSEDDVESAVAEAAARFGRLHVMFNNAGIATPRPGMLLEDHTIDDWERLVAVNLRGVFFGCKSAVKQFKKQGDGGAIVNTASVAGMIGWGGAAYGATKGGVIQLTRLAAIEAAPYDIRVNAICPAAMPETRFMNPLTADQGLSPIELEGLAALHPLGRVITPEDCADAALFLAGDMAKNITGVALPVDGGLVVK